MKLLMGLIRGLLSRLLGGGQNDQDVGPEAAPAPTAPDPTTTETTDSSEVDGRLNDVVEVVGFDC